MQKYDPKKIEPKWQKYWEANKTFEVTEDAGKKKFYSLVEFPYPSGAGLHVGHPRPYTAMDVISRKKRMEGYNVLFPIGFDAFGLPTENYAIKTGRPPAEVTAENIATFTRQLKSLGYSFDWSRTVDTTDPAYFKWTQWIFLKFYNAGLAYKTSQPINWCPKDKIGLANEEAAGGVCDRCGGPVEKRNKEQWMLAITKYADKLLEGLKEVDYIPQARLQQENWIGRSEGAIVKFQIPNSKFQIPVEVFTTRPDTIFGVTFLAVSPELAKKWLDVGWQTNEEVKTYIEKTLKERAVANASREEQEKTGVAAGIFAINPVSGEEIPVWITNYVLGDVGTGAIMAVPAHDERDFEFAKKYNLPIKEVVAKIIGKPLPHAIRRDGACAVIMKDGKVLILYTKKFDFFSLPSGGYNPGETAIETIHREITEETGYTHFEITDYLGEIEKNLFAVGRNENRYKLHKGYLVELIDEKSQSTNFDDYEDYENYWVTPEEAIKKLSANPYKYGDEEFVKRSLDQKLRCFQDDGSAVNSDFLNGLSTSQTKDKIISILEEKGIGKRQVNYKLRDWVFSRQRYWGEPIPLVKCEKCADWIPVPESELPLKLPEVKKYEPTDNGESPLATMTDWVNTKCPHCGGPAKRETDTMPNWAGSSWYWLRYTDPKNDQAFASKDKLAHWTPVDWYNGGNEHTVLHLLYSRFWNQFLFDQGLVTTLEPYKKRTSHGIILAEDGEKMSKSRGNVINPDEMVDQFGADALRTYIMFMGPFDQAVAWSTNGLVGVRRFLDRVWNLQEKVVPVILNNPPGRGSEESLNVGDKGSFAPTQNDKVTRLLHQTIKKVTADIDGMRFNTAIAALMELVNEMNKADKIFNIQYSILVQLLSPFAPHLAEELWQLLGNTTGISVAPWPTYDPALIVADEIELVVQINGKLRDTLTVPTGITEDEAKQLALSSAKVQKWLEGKEPKKVIYVKGKLVSIVV